MSAEKKKRRGRRPCPPPGYVTSAEAAEAIGIARQTLHENYRGIISNFFSEGFRYWDRCGVLACKQAMREPDIPFGYVDTAAAAKYVGCTQKTVCNHVAAGKARHVILMHGRRRRIYINLDDIKLLWFNK